ncbi:MAG: polyprenyl synthetase family protein, partial [Micrococcales bacterium]|nr:polyprenyl synthetase family protein [Micrococcales bacterium]
DTAPRAEALVDVAAALLAGGKRLRASFAYWSWRAHGGAPGTAREECALRAGAALELFHAAALAHDDVIDDSDTRRGQPAAHRQFAARHRRAHLTGDADRFGTSAAILLGDLLLIAGDAEFAAALAGLPEPTASRARAVFDTMRTEVTAGQYLDLLAEFSAWEPDPDRVEAAARQVIRTKSARYSVEQPLVLGAALAGADDDALATCRTLGLPLGEAFQLRDDLLGVFGDPAVTGKPAGDDLREGKRTVLVARALRLAGRAGDTATVDLLRTRLGDPAASSDQVAELARAVAATGAPDEVEQLIATLAGPALDLLERQAWPADARAHLAELARRSVDRHR